MMGDGAVRLRSRGDFAQRRGGRSTRGSDGEWARWECALQAGRRLAALGGKRFLNENRHVWSGVNRRDAPLAWLKGFCGKAALKRTRRLAYKREELCVFRQGSSLVGRSAFPTFPRRGVLLGRKRRHFGAFVLRGARQSDMIDASDEHRGKNEGGFIEWNFF